jgi:hypothetical protein
MARETVVTVKVNTHCCGTGVLGAVATQQCVLAITCTSHAVGDNQSLLFLPLKEGCYKNSRSPKNQFA